MANPLEMSDADFLNAPFDSFSGIEEDTKEQIENTTTDDNSTDEVLEKETDVVEETTEQDETDSDDKRTEEEATDSSEESDNKETTDKDESKESDSDAEEKRTEETKLSADEQLAQLFKPFKANGKDIAVSSVDEAVKLMQMGANYNKKMTSLKPVMKVARMLENNGLMSEDEVSFLIDLRKKNPEAISKLLKDSEINPLDIDLDKSSDYKGGNHIVSDAQLKVEEVLETIRETPTFNRTINVVTKEWDESSKQFFVNSPEAIAEINSHMQEGIFDIVNSEVEKQRMLGGLVGLNSIQAYKVVGDMLNAQGKFDSAPAQKVDQALKVQPNVTNQKQPDPKIKAKKQAAGITQGKKVAPKVDNDFNPLALSDEEFEKQFGNKLL